jgi:hypothetical protein
MTKDTGGPAFPFIEKESTGMHYHSHSGMTLRDWFAGQVLGALISCDGISNATEVTYHAEVAYAQADAMILERNKP